MLRQILKKYRENDKKMIKKKRLSLHRSYIVNRCSDDRAAMLQQLSVAVILDNDLGRQHNIMTIWRWNYGK